MRLRIWMALLLFLFSLNIVYGLTQEEKIYFDAQNQKVVAQINAKLDTEGLKWEQVTKKEFQDSTYFIQNEIQHYIVSGVKLIIFGMTGVMVLVLALFKIFDLQITQTKLIKNYETELKKKIENHKKAKFELDMYKEYLKKTYDPEKKSDKILAPMPKYIKKNKLKKILFIVGAIILIIILIIAFLYFAIQISPPMAENVTV